MCAVVSLTFTQRHRQECKRVIERAGIPKPDYNIIGFAMVSADQPSGRGKIERRE